MFFQLCVLGSRVHRGQVEPQHQDRPEEGDGGAKTGRLVSRNPCQICQDFHSGVETLRCLRNAKRVKKLSDMFMNWTSTLLLTTLFATRVLTSSV